VGQPAVGGEEKDAIDSQRRAEIAALEAQINPHFLYNTLDTINWIAIDNDEYEISNAITSLAAILRYGIDNSNADVRVSREAEWLKQYLFLQQIRLKNTFQCEIHVSQEVMDWKIHKLLFQPFVENSLYHGFQVEKDVYILRVEIEPGVLMLNMRDNRGGSRAVAITEDLGKTWTEHESSRKALQEPVCMASLIHVRAEDNVLGRDILLFSNPNTKKGRNHITIKASLDKGLTWLPENQVMLDEDEGWGYTCLTMIDRETVGILYESSVAHMTFQAIKLKDLIRE